MSHLFVKNTLFSLSRFVDPIDVGALCVSFFCFFLFIISQPFIVSSVPYPDMVLIEMLGYQTSQDYMNLLYGVTGLLAVGVLYMTFHCVQGGLHGLGIMIFSFLMGYILLALSHVISLSMIISICCLWMTILMSMRMGDNVLKQILCYSLLMIAACLMPHFAIATAGVMVVFLIIPLVKKEISGLYYAAQFLIIGCVLLLGLSLCVFMLGFDVQAFKVVESYADGVILALFMYGLYYIMQYVMHIPRHTPLYYVSIFMPLIGVTLLAGRFTGTLI